MCVTVINTHICISTSILARAILEYCLMNIRLELQTADAPGGDRVMPSCKRVCLYVFIF